VLDHADRDGLIDKYRHDPSVTVAMIEPVDFVWTQGTLSDAVPLEHHGTFNAFLASHVIEHVPDFVNFMHSAEVLCRSDATMILAVPDKRVCFDFFRPLSTTGDVLVAHWEHRSRHSAKTLWDFVAYQATKHGGAGWGRTDQSPLAFAHSLADAANMTQRHGSQEYVDAHGWTFVPASFSLIMLELAHLGLTDWQVERMEAAEYTEFYVWLQRGAQARKSTVSQPELATERMRLLTEILMELDDQGRQLAARQRTDLTDSLARAQAELAATRNTLDTVRSSRAWRTRSALRRLLGLPATLADA
jgi:hypothetical protein